MKTKPFVIQSMVPFLCTQKCQPFYCTAYAWWQTTNFPRLWSALIFLEDGGNRTLYHELKGHVMTGWFGRVRWVLALLLLSLVPLLDGAADHGHRHQRHDVHLAGFFPTSPGEGRVYHIHIVYCRVTSTFCANFNQVSLKKFNSEKLLLFLFPKKSSALKINIYKTQRV